MSAAHAHGVTSGVDVEFSIDPAKVCFDGVDRDEQIRGDRFGGIARDEMLQYLLFSLRVSSVGGGSGEASKSCNCRAKSPRSLKRPPNVSRPGAISPRTRERDVSSGRVRPSTVSLRVLTTLGSGLPPPVRCLFRVPPCRSAVPRTWSSQTQLREVLSCLCQAPDREMDGRPGQVGAAG